MEERAEWLRRVVAKRNISIRDLPSGFGADRELVLAAIAQDRIDSCLEVPLSLVAPELNADREVVLAAVSQKNDISGLSLESSLF